METIQSTRKPSTEQPPVPVTGAAGGAMAMEVAHVLFMDVVGYSKLRMQQQADMQVELQKLVQSTPEAAQARKDNKLIVRPTGDGMALLFLRDLLSPVRCALQIHTVLQAREAEIKRKIGASIALRMGIHSGPVFMMEDLNAQTDVAGEGIIIAQRVMDCGDAGHILLSEEVAKKLLTVDPWPRYITNLGECRVKHGVRIHLYNLYGRLDGPYCGNPALPKKVQADNAAIQKEAKKYQPTFGQKYPAVRNFLAFGCVAGLLGGSGYGAWVKVPAVQTKVNGLIESWKNPGKVSAKTGKTKIAKPAPKSTSTNNTIRTTPRASSGAPMVQVPEVVGSDFESASQELRSVGLRVRKGTGAYNSSQGEGIVFSQNKASGKFVAAGTVITVRISKGDKPDPKDNSPVEPTNPDETPEPGTTAEPEASGGISGDPGE